MFTFLQAGSEWQAAGHEIPRDLTHVIGQATSALLALGFVVLVLRAMARARWYRAVEQLSEADRAALLEEVGDVERRTVGEIVPVIVERSDRHPVASWIAGTAALGIGTAGLWSFGIADSTTVFAAQLVCFLAGFLLARALPDFRRLFVTERRAEEMAREQASQEFHAAGLHRTEAETGVLLFVSLFEHRVIVLGDRGIDAKVDAHLWESACDSVLSGIRSGDLKRGLSAGLQQIGDVLAEHFPWEQGDRDEVPNQVIVRAE